MSILSPCTIRFTPAGGSALTLVHAGGWLAELPAIDGDQPLFEAEGVFLSHAVFKPLDGVKINISFAIEDAPAASHAVAQEAFLAAASIGSVRLLNVEGALEFISAGQIATYSPAVISTLTPALPFDGDSVRVRHFRVATVLPQLSTP